ncbi:MAG: hypothetical protein ACOCXA_02915 [Planctomycetota bacterium]
MRLIIVILFLCSNAMPAADPAAIWTDARSHLLGNDIKGLVRSLVGEHWSELRSDWAQVAARPPTPEQERAFMIALAPLHDSEATDDLHAELHRLLHGNGPVQQAAAFEGIARDYWLRWRTLLPPHSQLHEHVGILIPKVAAWIVAQQPLDAESADRALDEAVAFVRRHDIRNSASIRNLDLEHLFMLCGDALGCLKRIAAITGIEIDAWLRSITVTSVSQDTHHLRFDITWQILDEHWTWHLQARSSPAGWMISEYHPAE